MKVGVLGVLAGLRLAISSGVLFSIELTSLRALCSYSAGVAFYHNRLSHPWYCSFLNHL